MRSSAHCFYISLLALASVAAAPAGFAVELEPWQTHTPQTVRVLYVDADAQGEQATGEAGAPLPTIQAAVDHALQHTARGEATRIIVRPGVYRETIDITDRGGEQGPSLEIVADRAGEVVISGSDVLTDWRRDGENWTHDWSLELGWVDNPWPGLMPMDQPGFRRELVFVDGQPLRQVFDADHLAAGTYLVDDDARTLRVVPPVGVALNEATVEASVRPTAKYGPHSKLLRADGISNLTLRGLVFRHAASLPFHDPAVALRKCRNVVIEDCTIELNGGVGLGGEVVNAKLTKVRANRNGTLGMEGKWSNALVESCQTNDNNWRGALFGATGWAPCGFKFTFVDGMILRDHQAIANHASGGWLDDSNRNVLIERFVGVNNVRSGLSLEANPGPIVVRDAVLMGNSTGLNCFDNRNVIVEQSLIADNASRQVRLSGSSPLPDEELSKITPQWRRHRLSSRQPPMHYTFRDTVIGATRRAASAKLIDYWMRGNFRDADGRWYLDALNTTLVLDRLTLSHPDPDSPLFPEPTGKAATWTQWSSELTNPKVTWAADRIDTAIRQAERRLGIEATGFGGAVNDEDPGL